MSSITIKTLAEEHRQSIIDLLLRSFFLQEPLNSVLKFDLPNEPLSWVNHILNNAVKGECSFVAIDTSNQEQRLVGVIINRISNENVVDNFVTPSPTLNTIFNIIDKLHAGYDFYQRFQTDRLFHCEVINIDESQRGQNLSDRLITAALEKAVQLKIQGALVVCTSIFSRKAFAKYGFQVINELIYSELGNEKLLNMGIHDRCTLLAKKL